MDERRIGVIQVSYCLLEQVLHLPEGHRVAGIRLIDNFTDTFEVAIEGPSLPVRMENQQTERVSYSITVTENRDEMVPKRTYTGKFGETRR